MDHQRWAKTKSGPVSAVDCPAEMKTFSCYECGDKLEKVCAHKRKRSGIEFEVASFFRHSKDTTCSGESIVHKASKDRRGLVYYDLCRQCGSEVCIDLDGRRQEKETNWVFEESTYRPDVSFLDDAGRLVSALEIHHTHAISDEKAEAYNKAKIAWVEVDALLHLEAEREIKVERSSFEQFDFLCQACHDPVLLHERMHRSKARALKVRHTRQQAQNQAFEAALFAITEKAKFHPGDESAIVDEFIAWQKEKHPAQDLLQTKTYTDFALTFFSGKHQNRHVDAVFKTDPEYLLFVIRNQSEQTTAKMKIHALLWARIRKLMKDRCQYCGIDKLVESWHTKCKNCFVNC